LRSEDGDEGQRAEDKGFEELEKDSRVTRDRENEVKSLKGWRPSLRHMVRVYLVCLVEKESREVFVEKILASSTRD